MSNTTKALDDDFNDIIGRPQIYEAQSRPLLNKTKQKKFRELCKTHAIVSDFGHKLNDIIDLIND